MRHPSTPIRLLMAAAVVLLASACGHDEAVTAQTQLEPLQVRLTSASALSESRPIEVRGIVQPTRQAMVSSRVMGPVVAVPVHAGTTVRAGQELVQIQPAASEGQLGQAKGALAQAQAALTLAERNLKRFEALHADDAASDLELDMARMQYEQASGAVKQAEGAVQAAATVADEASVQAPFAARVVARMVEVGDMASPGRPLVRIESLGGREMWLDVRESDITRVALGQELEVRIDSRPDLGALTGTVSEIVPVADPATHSFTVKLQLERTDLSSGLSGRTSLPGDVHRTIVVPTAAVHQRGGLELVIVRAADGTARTRAVTTGKTLAGDRIEILSGVDEGDEVVIDAAAPVPDGTPLEVRS